MSDLDRESILRRRISEAAARHRAAYEAEVEPWFDELIAIESRKPRHIVWLPRDGPGDCPRPLWMDRRPLPELG